MADGKGKQRNPVSLGVYFLFVLGLIVIDSFGVCFGTAEPAGYGPFVIALSLLGFGSGAALGAYFSAGTKPPTAWSPYYSLIYGLIGIAIMEFIMQFCLQRLLCR